MVVLKSHHPEPQDKHATHLFGWYLTHKHPILKGHSSMPCTSQTLVWLELANNSSTWPYHNSSHDCVSTSRQN
eukprot:5457279-Amphidinium_carterae.2